jgi:hypothetical protein
LPAHRNRSRLFAQKTRCEYGDIRLREPDRLAGFAICRKGRFWFDLRWIQIKSIHFSRVMRIWRGYNDRIFRGSREGWRRLPGKGRHAWLLADVGVNLPGGAGSMPQELTGWRASSHYYISRIQPCWIVIRFCGEKGRHMAPVLLHGLPQVSASTEMAFTA